MNPASVGCRLSWLTSRFYALAYTIVANLIYEPMDDPYHSMLKKTVQFRSSSLIVKHQSNLEIATNLFVVQFFRRLMQFHIHLKDPFFVQLLSFNRDVERHITQPPPITKRVDPLGLPSHKAQCVHVWVEEETLSEGVEVTYPRCPRTVVLGRHGFLCSEHEPYTNQLPIRRLRGDEEGELRARMQKEVEGATEVAVNYKNYAHIQKDDESSRGNPPYQPQEWDYED